MDAHLYLPIIQQFIPDTTAIQLLHTYGQTEYDGVFYYIMVGTPRLAPRTVCLLESGDLYQDPLALGGTFPLLEGVEQGYGYAVVGCYSTQGDIVKVNCGTEENQDGLRLKIADKYYYLYLLAK